MYICMYAYIFMYACIVQRVSSHVIWKIDINWRGYKIQETLYIDQRCPSPLQRSHLGISQPLFHCSKHIAKSFVGIAISYADVFSWVSSIVWNLFPFKGDFSLGKIRICRALNLGYRGMSQLGYLIFCQKLCMRRDAWAGVSSRWSCRSPVTHICTHFHHIESLSHQRTFM